MRSSIWTSSSCAANPLALLPSTVNLALDRLQLTTRRQFLGQRRAVQLWEPSPCRRCNAGTASTVESPCCRCTRITRPRPSASSTCTCRVHRRTLDIFDYKPRAGEARWAGLPRLLPERPHLRLHQWRAQADGTPRTFKQYGQAGMWMSDAVPNFHNIADDITTIRSMHTDQFNHAPAELLLFTGHARQGRPSYGIMGHLWPGHRKPGPARLRRAHLQRHAAQRRTGTAGAAASSRACIQGVQCRSKGDPVLFVSDPARHGSRHAPPHAGCAEGSERAASRRARPS